MLFGLTNATAVFQAPVNNVLRDMLDKFVCVYTDILIFSHSMDAHVNHGRLMLQRLLKQPFCEIVKMWFSCAICGFLEVYYWAGQLKPDLPKTWAVFWPVLTNCKWLQRFLGFAFFFFWRFIRNYSRIVAPLTELNSIKLNFAWFPAAQSTFANLKTMFSSVVSPWPQTWVHCEGRLFRLGSGGCPLPMLILGSESPPLSGWHLWSGTMMWKAVSCWQLSWPYRSGVTG